MAITSHEKHFVIIKSAFHSYIDNDEDILIVTNDGKTMLTNQKLLCFYSKEVSEMLSDLRENNSKERVTIVVDSSFRTILTLLDILRVGVAYNQEKDALETVLEAAKALGMNISNLYIDQERYNYSLLLKEDSDCISSVFEELDDTVLAFSEEDTSRENMDQFGDCFVTLSESVIPAVEQLSKPANISEHQGSFSCELCGKYFKSGVKLKIHSLFHSNFKCDKCSEGFRMPSLLNLHKRTCTGDILASKRDNQLKVPNPLVNSKTSSTKVTSSHSNLQHTQKASPKMSTTLSCGRLLTVPRLTTYVSRSLII